MYPTSSGVPRAGLWSSGDRWTTLNCWGASRVISTKSLGTGTLRRAMSRTIRDGFLSSTIGYHAPNRMMWAPAGFALAQPLNFFIVHRPRLGVSVNHAPAPKLAATRKLDASRLDFCELAYICNFGPVRTPFRNHTDTHFGSIRKPALNCARTLDTAHHPASGTGDYSYYGLTWLSFPGSGSTLSGSSIWQFYLAALSGSSVWQFYLAALSGSGLLSTRTGLN